MKVGFRSGFGFDMTVCAPKLYGRGTVLAPHNIVSQKTHWTNRRISTDTARVMPGHVCKAGNRTLCINERIITLRMICYVIVTLYKEEYQSIFH